MKTVNNFVQSEKAEFSCSVRSFLPKYAMVPLCQSSEKEGSCTIIEGETVHEGDVLSKGNAFVHSSIPGSVDEIVTCTLPNGRTGKAVKIKLKGSFSYLGKKGKPQELSFMTPDYLTEKFTECGVINTFTAPAKPLCNEVKKCTAKKEKFLVVRMFDEDPSRVTDTFTAENYSSEVVTGALCIAKSFNAEGIVFVCPKKKFRMPGFSELGEFPYITVETDTTKYPCGFRANLLECIKRNSKSLTSQFFSGVNINSLFVDPETCVAAFNAATYGIPVVENFVHVTGTCLKSAALFRARIGTPISDLAEQCGGFKRTPAKILVNGILLGSSISSLDTPITKYVKSVTFLPEWELSNQNMSPCIRCGKCRRVCPENLLPDLLFRSYEQSFPKKDTNLLKTTALCTGCALCNAVCPSRLPLSHIFSLMRKNSNE